MTAPVVEFAPAKINLALHVTGRRPDGYHLLDMLVAFAGTGDRVSVLPASSDSFAVTGRFADAVPTDASNLVLRARDALRDVSAAAGAPVAIALEKNLPPASGMGGGSSDAAALLRALNRLSGLGLGADRLASIGLSLGADVPMCLVGAPLRARGIGEMLRNVTPFAGAAIVLVNPGTAVSTPDAFRALASRDNPPLPDPTGLGDTQALAAYVRATRNDLQDGSIRLEPSIGLVLDALAATSPLAWRMTGSGATCFGLYDDDRAATRAAVMLRSAHPHWYVEATRIGMA